MLNKDIYNFSGKSLKYSICGFLPKDSNNIKAEHLQNLFTNLDMSKVITNIFDNLTFTENVLIYNPIFTIIPILVHNKVNLITGAEECNLNNCYIFN